MQQSPLQASPSPAPAPSPVAPHFIEAYPGALAPEQCRAIIERFNADPRRFPSRSHTSLTPVIRTGTMINAIELPDWHDVVELVEATIRRHVAQYAEKYVAFQNIANPNASIVSPPVLERIDPGQGYGYHVDAGQFGTHHRMLHCLIYLADVAEGGYTEFPYQSVRIPPRAGLLILFPPFWTHPHRGVSPVSNAKYNISNFVTLKPKAIATS